MLKLILIAAGGALGALLRYGLTGVTQRASGGAFPWGTMLVNVLGCFAIGFLGAMFASASGPRIREEFRLALLVGVLGGFTTFSAFAWETLALTRDGALGRAAANVLLTNALCLAGAFAGYRIALRLYGA